MYTWDFSLRCKSFDHCDSKINTVVLDFLVIMLRLDEHTFISDSRNYSPELELGLT